jgi:hypothetical protein
MFYPSLSGGLSGYNTSLSQVDASNARADAREAKTETELMRHDIERLLMITEALWSFLKKEHGYTDEALMKVVNEIDLRDGRLDGKVAAKPPAACPSCGKINSNKRQFCMYCGNALPADLFGR